LTTSHTFLLPQYILTLKLKCKIQVMIYIFFNNLPECITFKPLLPENWLKWIYCCSNEGMFKSVMNAYKKFRQQLIYISHFWLTR